MNSEQRGLLPAKRVRDVEIAYSLLYLALLIPGLAFVVWYEYAYKVVDSVSETAYAILVGIGYVGVADAAITVGVIEGGIAIMVLARRWLEREAQRGFEQGIEQGIEQGREQGKEAGRQEVQLRWENWNLRRRLAEVEGREFSEPPPSLDDK